MQPGFDNALLKAAVANNLPQDLGHSTLKKRRKDSQITVMPDNTSWHEEYAEDSKQSTTNQQQSVQDLTIVEDNTSVGNDVAKLDENGRSQESIEDDEDDCSQLDTDEDCEEQSKGSINTEQMNFRKIIDGLSREQKEIEKAASDGQKKQAVEVNKGRAWIGGENIENNTICTL